jgi:hypothetical protein
LEGIQIDGRIILKWKVVDWIHVAYLRDKRQAVVNTVMKTRFVQTL